MMMSPSAASHFFAFAVLCLTSVPVYSEITGRISLQGTPLYPDAVIDNATDKHCQEHGEIKTSDWIISPEGGLGDVVVSIVEPPAGATADSPKKIDILQEGCTYKPHVSALLAGGQASIKNGDDTLHNVRGVAFLGRGKRSRPLFNIGQPVKGMVLEHTFKETGTYKLNCDVHPWMEAWVLVFPHPFFAVSAPDGTFSLPAGLPDGEYTAQSWHSRFKTPLIQKITVTGGKAEMNFTFDATQSQ